MGQVYAYPSCTWYYFQKLIIMDTLYASAMFNCADLKNEINYRMVLIGLSSILLGLLLYVLFLSLNITVHVVQMLSITACVACVFFGIYILFTNPRRVVYAPTRSVVRCFQFYYDKPDLAQLTRMLVFNDDFPNDLKVENKSDGDVRLDVLMSDDNEYVSAKLYVRKQNAYYSYSNIVMFELDNADKASNYFHRCMEGEKGRLPFM